MRMFSSALFVIKKKPLKLPKCPLTRRWINKLDILCSNKND
jgi:hypothetical protein